MNEITAAGDRTSIFNAGSSNNYDPYVYGDNGTNKGTLGEFN